MIKKIIIIIYVFWGFRGFWCFWFFLAFDFRVAFGFGLVVRELGLWVPCGGCKRNVSRIGLRST